MGIYDKGGRWVRGVGERLGLGKIGKESLFSPDWRCSGWVRPHAFSGPKLVADLEGQAARGPSGVFVIATGLVRASAEHSGVDTSAALRKSGAAFVLSLGLYAFFCRGFGTGG